MLTDFLANGHDLEEWFPGAFQDRVPVPDVGAPPAALDRWAALSMMDREDCATKLAELLTLHGWRTVEAALTDALRGLAVPPEPSLSGCPESARIDDAYQRGLNDAR